MGRGVILDSTYLIDFERECQAGVEGPAHDSLGRLAATRLHISFAALGELAAGYPGSRDAFEHAMPVATRDTERFQRVPGLEIVAY